MLLDAKALYYYLFVVSATSLISVIYFVIAKAFLLIS